MLATRWFLEVTALPDLLWAQLVVHDDAQVEVLTVEGGPQRFAGAAEAEAWLAGAAYRPFEDLLWEMAVAPETRAPEVPMRQRPAGEALICRHCRKPITVNKARYASLERMHWLCFHLTGAHADFDPDEPCADPACPWRRLEAAGHPAAQV